MYTKSVSVLSTGASTQDITFTPNSGDPSWTPKVAIFNYSRANTAADAFAEHMSSGYGFTDGTNQRCTAVASEDNAARSDTATIQRDNALLCALNPTGVIETVDCIATFNSWLSNGIRINWTDAPAANFYFNVLFLGGDDIQNVGVGTLMSGTGTGNVSVTDKAFQADVGMFITGGSATINTPVVIGFQSIGAATSSSAQWSQGIYSQDNPVTMITNQWYSHSNVIGTFTNAGLTGLASLSSFTSTGFTLNISDAFPASIPIFYLIIKGGNFAVGNATEIGTVTTQTITTNMDTKAVGIFGLDIGTVDTVSTGCMQTIGLGDNAFNQGVEVFEDTNGTADSVVVSRHDTNQIYLNITSNITAASSTLDDEAALSAVSSTSFTLNWTNIGQARPYRYITFGTGPFFYQRPISETSVSVSESLTTQELYIKPINESSISVSESLDDTETYPRPISDTSISVSESVTKTVTYLRSISDSSVSVSDNVERTHIESSGELYNVHFYEFPEDVSDSIYVPTPSQIVTRTHTHKYHVDGKVTSSKTHRYNVTGKVTRTHTHKYNILNRVSTTKIHVYDILVKVTQTRIHKYSIRILVTRTRTHKYSIQSKITRTHIHKWNLGGRIVRTHRHIYDLQDGKPVSDNAGSTTVLLKFPERIRIVDIISDIRNLALANIEIFDSQIKPQNIAIGVVELDREDSRLPLSLRTASSHYKFRCASKLIVPEIQVHIEHKAISSRIAIQIHEPTKQSLIKLESLVQLRKTQYTYAFVASKTQLRQTKKTILSLTANTQIQYRKQIRAASNIQLPHNFGRQLIKVPEVMTLESEQTLRALIEVLKNDELFH